MNPPPPPFVMRMSSSGTTSRTICSSRSSVASVRSMRVPTGISTSTCTSPSSVVGMSSDPMVGSRTSASTNRPVPATSTVGRWCSERWSSAR
jgi:hypothetical protein